MGGLVNYKFGSKNIWRRWIWNCVKDYAILIGKKPKDMFGMFLIGECDDIDVALAKGFKKSNLIGIDIDKESVKKLRNKNGIAINSRIQDILINWDGEEKFDFIIADFCCGLTRQVKEFIACCCCSRAINSKTLFVINLLRGRDNIYYIEEEEEDPKYKNFKHRGAFFLWIVSEVINHSMETWPSLNIPAHSFEDFEPKVFNSYKSIVNGAHLFLDSVIFKWPLDKVTPKMKKNELIFRKITAAKAIRTMKKAA